MRKILIVKLNMLGDMVTFLPAMNSIRQGYPRAQITLLTTPVGSELIKDTGLVDQIWLSGMEEIKTLKGFIHWFSLIARSRFDLAVTSYDTPSFIALALFLSLIPIRVGYTCAKLDFLYNRRVPFSKKCHTIELGLLAVKQLGLTIDQKRPALAISQGDQRAVENLLRSRGVSNFNGLIGIHPGAKRASRRWPLERFAELVDRLSEQSQVKVVCVGTKNEKPLVKTIQSLMKKGELVDLVGKTTVKQLAYLISLFSVFICPASGPMHLAFLMGTHTISLWGATCRPMWRPIWKPEKHICLQADLDCLGCEQVECPTGTLECMNLITVDMVTSAVSKILEKK